MTTNEANMMTLSEAYKILAALQNPPEGITLLLARARARHLTVDEADWITVIARGLVGMPVPGHRHMNLTASPKDALDSLFALSNEQIAFLASIVCPDAPMEGYSGRPLAHVLDATLVPGVDGEQAIRNLLALLG